MASEYDSFSDVAREYGDCARLAQTAQQMGAHETAQGWLDEADRVRQAHFGSDDQFKR